MSLDCMFRVQTRHRSGEFAKVATAIARGAVS